MVEPEAEEAIEVEEDDLEAKGVNEGFLYDFELPTEAKLLCSLVQS